MKLREPGTRKRACEKSSKSQNAERKLLKRDTQTNIKRKKGKLGRIRYVFRKRVRKVYQ
jgi:hypothetical protein